LLEQKKLQKIGKAPHTKYKLATNQLVPQKVEKKSVIINSEVQIDYKTRKILDEVFLKFSPI